ncbi:MAG TPA: hypothetical protein VGX16_00690 [Solirubrobacteraceae bacterium]|jgi:hypothetical protein|nr:hypothetical protein [Solirubrobacteraceae bacterium]
MPLVPFNMPSLPGREPRRTRLAIFAATVGIAGALLAYAISPGVRHAVVHAEHSVSHAAHSVGHAVGHLVERVFPDHDDHARPPRRHAAPKPRAAPRGVPRELRGSRSTG